MNRTMIMGRITKDLELKYTSTEMAILKFTVAVNRMKKGEVDFISCVAFKDRAENIAKFFTKGRMIAIEGRMQTGSYDNKEGQKVYTTDIMVDSFHFTGEKREATTQESEFALVDELPF